ncbi:GMC oxidoreductase [Pseudooceanicola sp.]|uniref:GMC oxidoreductase n=1 Tax=Pseudooceanicola sp. TaxID=1914328 RepID=UPI00260642F1|nr:GMC oxidoreductase [Pseudooceanicola sp.]MDF1855733.1 GMC oxidoreductase [Pseudooceanicola sp.]
MGSDSTDAVVIGSGFGGSVTAARLAESGVQVTVLERGPWWDTVPVRSMGIKDRTPLPRGISLFARAMRSVYHPLLPWGRTRINRKGLFEVYYSRGMEVVCSSGVGGGSHVYSALHRRPARPDYWDGHCPDLNEASMAPHYAAFVARVGSTRPGPDNAPPHSAMEIYSNHPEFTPVVPKDEVRVGFRFPEDPANPKLTQTEAGIERWETDYSTGDHGFLGAPSGSKSTMDFVYLGPAIRKGLEVRALCEAISISAQTGGGRRFRVDYFDHNQRVRATIEADNVFLGAGTMNTLRLLLESRDRYHGLSGMPNLGKRFSGNGDIRGFWDLNDQDRDYSEGVPSKGAIKLRDESLPQVGIGRNNLPSVNSYPFPKFIRERLKRGMVVSGMGEDAMDGVATSEGRRFRIHFDPSNSPIYRQIHDALMEMGRRSGRRIYAGKTPATVHPMGGACVGEADAGGVIAANGEVHGVPGLYVVDAAAFPRPTASPPTLSIGAWAENVAARFLARG